MSAVDVGMFEAQEDSRQQMTNACGQSFPTVPLPLRIDYRRGDLVLAGVQQSFETQSGNVQQKMITGR